VVLLAMPAALDDGLSLSIYGVATGNAGGSSRKRLDGFDLSLYCGGDQCDSRGDSFPQQIPFSTAWEPTRRCWLSGTCLPIRIATRLDLTNNNKTTTNLLARTATAVTHWSFLGFNRSVGGWVRANNVVLFSIQDKTVAVKAIPWTHKQGGRFFCCY